MLAVGKSAGWLGGGHSTTIVFRSSPSATEVAAPAAVGPVAKPLIGGSFDPARIYAARSSGVVTIFAVYGSSNTAQTAQGSGFVVSREGYILTNSHVITTAGDGNGRAKPKGMKLSRGLKHTRLGSLRKDDALRMTLQFFYDAANKSHGFSTNPRGPKLQSAIVKTREHNRFWVFGLHRL